MAITSYCKKCGRDVPLGEKCPLCGAKLAKNASRVAWCLEHTPVKDWISWNAVLRMMVPAAAVLLVMILLLEALVGGLPAAEALLSGGLLLTWVTLCLTALLLLWLVLAAQGKDLLDCVADSKGVKVTTYLPHPTALKLLGRLQSPRRLTEKFSTPQGEMLMLQTREIAWREISRVQLWPEKTCVLLYAPAWWLRLSLMCGGLHYADVLAFMRDKVGRRKDLLLPEDLRAAPKPRRSAGSKRASFAVEERTERTEELPARETANSRPQAADTGAESLPDLSGGEEVLPKSNAVPVNEKKLPLLAVQREEESATELLQKYDVEH